MSFKPKRHQGFNEQIKISPYAKKYTNEQLTELKHVCNLIVMELYDIPTPENGLLELTQEMIIYRQNIYCAILDALG
jgi:hypothetical protein